MNIVCDCNINPIVKLNNLNLCIRCYLDRQLPRCGNCEMYFHNRELLYDCINCHKQICSIECASVINSKTYDCICRKCFDCKCEICDAKIESNLRNYYWDKTPFPRCNNCIG
jgi:hypothetical protein